MAIQRPTRFEHPRRAHPITYFAIHSTGSSDPERALRYYETNPEGISPHFVVVPDGSVVQLVKTSHVAYHVGLTADRRRAYQEGLEAWQRVAKDGTVSAEALPRYAEWIQRWPAAESPLELPCGASPNGKGVGIELACERGKCTPAMYDGLGGLLRGLSATLGVALTKETLLGHSDCDPIARSGPSGLTDPGPLFDWDQLYDLTLTH